MDRRIGRSRHPDIQDRNCYGDVKPIGDSKGRHPCVLIYEQIDPVRCGDDIIGEKRFSVHAKERRNVRRFSGAESWFAFVLVDGAQFSEVHTIGSIEVEVLIAEADE